MKKSQLEMNEDGMNKAIKKALTEFKKHKDKCDNKEIIVVINMVAPSYEKRLCVYNVKDKEIVRSHHVSHGTGSSNKSNIAYAKYFSNIPESHKSSLGAMVTDDTYRGKHGYSMRINGLDKTLNSEVRRRYIVMHKAHYVTDRYILSEKRAGQSWGCFAVDPAIYKSLIDTIKKGVFLYTYY